MSNRNGQLLYFVIAALVCAYDVFLGVRGHAHNWVAWIFAAIFAVFALYALAGLLRKGPGQPPS